MTHVLGRRAGDGPVAELGAFLARDGSRGAPVSIDLDRPHAGLVTGKRGSGKSYTMGVLAEGLAEASGVTGVIIDPMGVFSGLAEGTRSSVVDDPSIRADALAPRAWCNLLDLDPTGAPGALLWRAAETATTLDEMVQAVEHSQAPKSTAQAVRNHLTLAEQWDVFDPDGLATETLLSPGVTVIDGSELATEALAAITAAIAGQLYDATARGAPDRLPWLLIDEAQTVTGTVASRPIHAILTRGRHPGVSIVLGTQRPSALPAVAISQADIILSHRLTATSDIDALAAARPTYLDESVVDRLPDGVGEAVVIDDATESAVTVKIRERRTPHGGSSPRASAFHTPTPDPATESETASP